MPHADISRVCRLHGGARSMRTIEEMVKKQKELYTEYWNYINPGFLRDLLFDCQCMIGDGLKKERVEELEEFLKWILGECEGYTEAHD